VLAEDDVLCLLHCTDGIRFADSLEHCAAIVALILTPLARRLSGGPDCASTVCRDPPKSQVSAL
jgi:hypothetical protein